jgi:hypothetical protein
VKRKAEDQGDGERETEDKGDGEKEGEVSVSQVEVDLARCWVDEIKGDIQRRWEKNKEHERDGDVREIFVSDFWDGEDEGEAWDDVKGGSLPLSKVREARSEEVV